VTKGVLNYNRFEAIVTATKPFAYVFSARFTEVAAKLREHGIPVEVLSDEQLYLGEAFSVEKVAKQKFVQNNHQNSVLQGDFLVGQKEFGVGDFYVPMNHRLANMAFYLLEPQADDGLAYWNFFDAHLESALEQVDAVDYPVFKVMH